MNKDNKPTTSIPDERKILNVDAAVQTRVGSQDYVTKRHIADHFYIRLVK